MASYTKKSGKKDFDWNKFLNKRTITDLEWIKSKEKAASWVSCACGEQCSVIPRTGEGAPLDKKLLELGGAGGFYGAIADRDIKRSKAFLAKIEKRSAFLINQIRKELDDCK